jgi:predicted transcriptional regulator
MSSTTTLKLAEGLKARIAPLAAAAGKTTHAWMVEALEAQVALAEMREAFIAEAHAAAEAIDRGGALYAAEDVRAYILGLADGRAGKRPAPLKRAMSRAKTGTR